MTPHFRMAKYIQNHHTWLAICGYKTVPHFAPDTLSINTAPSHLFVQSNEEIAPSRNSGRLCESSPVACIGMSSAPVIKRILFASRTHKIMRWKMWWICNFLACDLLAPSLNCSYRNQFYMGRQAASGRILINQDPDFWQMDEAANKMQAFGLMISWSGRTPLFSTFKTPG